MPRVSAESSSRSQGEFDKPSWVAPWKLQLHELCDVISELVIYAMVVFSPWAFGTTQDWSINVMRWLGYVAGGLLAVKLALRWTSRNCYARWDQSSGEQGGYSEEHAMRLRFLTRSLAILTVAILGYCFISAYNARSTYNWASHTFDEHRYISWLPHSFDDASSWAAFHSYLALALTFWAMRDWLLGKTAGDQVAGRIKPNETKHRSRRLPDRLRRLFWVLTINGGLLAIEGIVQRLSGTGELLFMLRPSRVHFDAQTQFGPYAYRSNACQYFNLIWPLSLGFWWSLQRMAQSSDRQRKRDAAFRHLVLVSVGLMALCPLISSSRLGGLTALFALLVAGAVLWSAQRSLKAKLAIVMGVCLIVGIGFWLGWGYIAPRLESKELAAGFDTRNTIYEAGQKMAEDYPLFGTGPGTFMPLYQFYRPNGEEWVAQMHNDWLETRVTFGWMGSLLIGLALIVALVRWVVPGGIGGGRRLPMFLWVAVGGCMVQAIWDFPMQVYSILFGFLMVCAILSVLTRRKTS